MIKTGVHDVGQLRNGASLKGLFGGRKKVSVTLYDQIADEPDADYLAERILLLFADERGAYKRTYGKRFEAFDSDAVAVLQKHLAARERFLIHDVGVSDGRTACDFFQRLAQSFPSVSFIASDYSPTVSVIARGGTKVTLSHAGHILELVWPPFVLNTVKHDSYLYYPVNFLVRLLVERFAATRLIQDYHAGKLEAYELSLFAHKAKMLEQQDKRFHLCQHDLLTPFTERAHVIRAMNVLNRSYFSGVELAKVIKNVYAGLVDGGLLITGSNEEAESLVCGAVFGKTLHGFRRVWQSGEPSPVDRQILEFFQPAPAGLSSAASRG